MYCDFNEEELELLAYGFGFYVQDFNHADDSPVHALLEKLYRLRDNAEDEAIETCRMASGGL